MIDGLIQTGIGGVEFPIAPSEPWVRDALCAQVDPELFFPEGNHSPDDAVQVCCSCDVRVQCLAYALRTGQSHGVWGGKSQNQLARMREKVVSL